MGIEGAEASAQQHVAQGFIAATQHAFLRGMTLTSSIMQCRLRPATTSMKMPPWSSPVLWKAWGRPSTPAPTKLMKRLPAQHSCCVSVSPDDQQCMHDSPTSMTP